MRIIDDGLVIVCNFEAKSSDEDDSKAINSSHVALKIPLGAQNLTLQGAPSVLRYATVRRRQLTCRDVLRLLKALGPTQM
ncbi:hypothetical protein TNCV_2334491 [Trichonephila clavipes]|nr:hypothetical protein TNCV_2334491 [Trichonephila clavipes]